MTNLAIASDAMASFVLSAELGTIMRCDPPWRVVHVRAFPLMIAVFNASRVGSLPMMRLTCEERTSRLVPQLPPTWRTSVAVGRTVPPKGGAAGSFCEQADQEDSAEDDNRNGGPTSCDREPKKLPEDGSARNHGHCNDRQTETAPVVSGGGENEHGQEDPDNKKPKRPVVQLSPIACDPPKTRKDSNTQPYGLGPGQHLQVPSRCACRWTTAPGPLFVKRTRSSRCIQQ